MHMSITMDLLLFNQNWSRNVTFDCNQILQGLLIVYKTEIMLEACF